MPHQSNNTHTNAGANAPYKTTVGPTAWQQPLENRSRPNSAEADRLRINDTPNPHKTDVIATCGTVGKGHSCRAASLA